MTYTVSVLLISDAGMPANPVAPEIETASPVDNPCAASSITSVFAWAIAVILSVNEPLEPRLMPPTGAAWSNRT